MSKYVATADQLGSLANTALTPQNAILLLFLVIVSFLLCVVLLK